MCVFFFFFCFFLRNLTYHSSIFIALVYARHTHLFFVRLSFQIINLHAKKARFFAFFARAQLCISSFACKLLYRHSTLIAEVNSCINFIFCITIIMLYLSKIRGNLKL